MWVGSRPTLTQRLTLPPGVDSAMKEEVQRLQSRVDLLEEVRPGVGQVLVTAEAQARI